jgi:hypothetical protein
MVPANPDPDDLVSQGDDHLRGIKLSVQGNVSGDADETRLKAAGANKLVAAAQGLRLIASSDVAATVTDIRVRDVADGTNLASLAHVKADAVYLRNQEDDGALRLVTRSSVGGLQTGVELVPGTGGHTALLYNAVETLRVANLQALVTGNRVTLQAASGEIPRYDVSNGDAGGSFDMSAAGVMRISTRLGDLSSSQTAVAATRDGKTALHHAGTEKLYTSAGGAEVSGDLSILNAAPTAVSHATRKDYVDDGLALKLALAGGTMTGQINGIAPTADANLTRKDYVDGRTGASSGANNARIEIGTATGAGGAQIECGLETSTLASGSVTFAAAFGANPVVLISQANGNPASEQNIQVTSVSTTGFSWQDNSGGANQKSWIAMGRRA